MTFSEQMLTSVRGEDVRDAFVKSVQEISADIPEPITEQRITRIMRDKNG